VANTVKKNPNDDPKKDVRVIDYACHTASKAKDGYFSNSGKNIDDVPQGKHRVEDYYIHD